MDEKCDGDVHVAATNGGRRKVRESNRPFRKDDSQSCPFEGATVTNMDARFSSSKGEMSLSAHLETNIGDPKSNIQAKQDFVEYILRAVPVDKTSRAPLRALLKLLPFFGGIMVTIGITSNPIDLKAILLTAAGVLIAVAGWVIEEFVPGIKR